jgi:hypothetical protein
MQKKLIKYLFQLLTFCSVLVIIESLAKFSFKYLYPSAENVQEISSRQFENQASWLDSYWEEYYKAVQLRFPQQRLPLHKAMQGKTINIDKNGWRKTTNIVQEKMQVENLENLKNKIFMFGNSTLWGVGCPDSLTIPSLFVQKLTKIHDTVQSKIPTNVPINVQNFAVCSWNSTQMLVQLQIELQKGNIPNMVVFLNGATDMSRTLVEGGLSETQNYTILNKKVQGKMGIDSNFIATNLEYLLQRVHIYKMYKKLQNLPIYRLQESNANNLAKQISDNYFKNYELIDSLSRQYNFKYLVCWQPISMKRAEELHPKDIFFRNFAIAVNQEIAKKNQEKSYLNFYNLVDSLHNKTGNLFLDYCHLTVLGNRYLTDILVERYQKIR